MKTFSLVLVAALAVSAVQAADVPTEFQSMKIPPIYIPFASFYENGLYVRSILVADKEGKVTWYETLAKCRDALFAQLEYAQANSAPNAQASINATCVPVPSMDLPRK